MDPRHFAWILGTAKTVEALGGKWAPSADYGQSIIRDYLASMIATTAPADPTPEDPRIALLKTENEQLRAELDRANAKANEMTKAISYINSYTGSIITK
jgi:hypothetical protein